MRAVQFQLRSVSRSQMIDISREVQDVIRSNQFTEGLCQVFIPHTTAGITINENADPDVQHDFLKALDKVIPWEDHYRHMEGNSAAHLKASLMGFSQTLLVEDGRLQLGTWQGIYFCEFDGPRLRKVLIKLIS